MSVVVAKNTLQRQFLGRLADREIALHFLNQGCKHSALIVIYLRYRRSLRALTPFLPRL